MLIPIRDNGLIWPGVPILNALFSSWLWIHVDHAVVWLVQRSDAVGLVVIDEEDNQTLLVHRISADDIYRRQEGIVMDLTCRWI